MTSQAVSAATVSIRKAEAEDRLDASGLAVRAFRDMRPLIPATDWMKIECAVKDAIAEDTSGRVFIAVCEENIVGCVRLSGPVQDHHPIFPSGFSYIRALSVDHAWRGLGVGRMLCNTCISFAQDDGANAIGLYVARSNAPARRLYDQLGFEDFLFIASLYGVPYDVMIKRLRASGRTSS